MAARELAAQSDGFGDGEHRRMSVGAMRDAKRVESGEELVGGKGRGGMDRARCGPDHPWQAARPASPCKPPPPI